MKGPVTYPKLAVQQEVQQPTQKQNDEVTASKGDTPKEEGYDETKDDNAMHVDEEEPVQSPDASADEQQEPAQKKKKTRTPP